MWERGGETSSVYAMQRAVVRTTRDYHACFGLSPAPAPADSPRARSIHMQDRASSLARMPRDDPLQSSSPCSASH